MDPGEALGDDGPTPEVAGLQCRMLPARALAIVLISNHHPPDAMFLSGKGGMRYEGEEDLAPAHPALGFLKFTGQGVGEASPHLLPKGK